MNILKVTVMRTNGPDKLILTSDKPCPFTWFNGHENMNLELSTDLPAEQGMDYAKKHFPEHEIHFIDVGTK